MRFWGWLGDQVVVSIGVAGALGLTWLGTAFLGWDFDRMVLFQLLWVTASMSWQQWKRDHP